MSPSISNNSDIPSSRVPHPTHGPLPPIRADPTSTSKVIPLQGSSSGFSITPDQLSKIVNFDERSNPEQIKFLNSKYGGVEGLARLLKTDLELGLRTIDSSWTGPTVDKVVQLRQEIFGTNIVPPPKSETILEIVINTIKEDPILKILILGAAVTLIIGAIEKEGWVEGLAILIAVIIVLTVTAGNDYSKDKKFKKLVLLQSDKKTKVIRGGRKDQISSWDIFVGDIVELAIGDEIPADGVFVKGNRVVIDESPLTGESIPVKKSHKSPFLFSGCQVSEGTGLMLVTCVGMRSSGGHIQMLLNEAQNKETVLQVKLRGIALWIGKVGFSAGIVTFLGLIIRFIISEAQIYNGKPYPASNLIKLLNFFNVSVTVIVLAVPEGLPLAVTISLAFSMFKMIKDRCFVRHLGASETMGEATAICTDKTGTLTENRMTVVKLRVGSTIHNGEGSGEPNITPFSEKMLPSEVANFLAECICVNSTCFLKERKNDTHPIFVGSATEGSLLVFCRLIGLDYELVRKNVKKVENGEYLFNSDRKRMSTLCEPRTCVPGQSALPLFRLYTKGAPEVLLNLCSSRFDHEATEILPLEETEKNSLLQTVTNWASDGLRTFGLAYRDFDGPLTKNERDDPEQNLTFVALLGIKDPVRRLVPEAVEVCQNAGITVRMVTGDNIQTACKIARECKILGKGGTSMEGPVFRALSKEEKIKIIPKLNVLARSSPADKHTLVSLLKEMGEVVAVTGDGTNDAPALKEADVGFAMGISGTQIAMNASDIILLDDNFISIVQSLKWGRNVLDAVRKFLQFQLSVNLVAVILTLIGSLVYDEPPLSPVQLLWVNLIMDTFGALALASDLPSEDILKKRPHSRNEPILNFQMRIYSVFQTVYQVMILLIILVAGDKFIYLDHTGRTDEQMHGLIRTIVFTTFVLLQVCNEITARQLDHEINFFKGFWVNRLFPSILVLILVIQVLMVQFAGSFMQTIALSPYEWGVCVGFAISLIPYITLCRIGVFLVRYFRNRSNLGPVNSISSLKSQTVIYQPKIEATSILPRSPATLN
ncbi:Calcium-transporting ATPase 10, plasma membrane-type [Coelomomyces lativittatus]|nr:Calcium-transporting ATPase 10, plasma membrane-type [Coelomomyces lativittatus]